MALKEKLERMKDEVDERDQVILDMKKSLECEQTDEIIYEGKVKQLQFDLEQQRAHSQGFLDVN